MTCQAFDMFRYGSHDHFDEHTRALGWYVCSVCPGSYPPDGDEDDHQAHAWGLFESQCEQCKAWEFRAKILLETLTELGTTIDPVKLTEG
jgi:hypothetical protein